MRLRAAAELRLFRRSLSIFGRLKNRVTASGKKNANANALEPRGRRARFVFNCGQIWSELNAQQRREKVGEQCLFTRLLFT